MKKCIKCGFLPTVDYMDKDGVRVTCMHCGRTTKATKSAIEALKIWNEIN